MAQMGRARVWFVLAGVVLFASSLQTQTATNTGTTITSATELVLIPTVVNDKGGAFVSGLRKEDFGLKQDGKTQLIAVFEEVKTDSTRMHRSEGEHGTFSNFEPGGSDFHRLNIIVLDYVNTPFADQANARSALVKFLSEAAESGEPMCLMALTPGGLRLLHDFTDDPKLLAAALREAGFNSTPLIHESVVEAAHPESGAMAAALTRMIRGQLQSEAELASTESKGAAVVTVESLQQIAKAFRGLPGRKSLIWASSGFPFALSPSSAETCEPSCPVHQHGEMQSAYDSLWRMMNDAQIAIYSIDLRSGDSDMLASGGVRPSDAEDPEFDIAAQEQLKARSTDSMLRQFAEQTGGKAFLGGGNLVKSFRQATQDDSSYYMLGYYLSRNSTKTGWHQVSLTVNRKGALARYRNGFILTRDTSATSAQQDIKLALLSPLDFVGVPISVTWSGSEAGKSAGKSRMQFDLVMPANFVTVDESDQNHMVVDIAGVARNLNGEVVADLSQRIESHLTPGALEQIRRNGMTYRNGLQLPPGEYTVRFVVRDSLGNRTGSVAAPIKVTP
jgi:VWFA-related protein